VDSLVERLDGSRELINRAYLVFVAIGEDEKPIPVPPFIPETLEEKKEYAAAESRRKNRLNNG
jgi:acyl-CoA hydrolase